MKGGSSHNWRIKKLSVTIGGLFCLTLAIWVWEKAPVLTTFVPSSDDFVTRFSTPSPVESPKTEYAHQQSSDVDVSPNPSTREVSSQSPSEGKLLGTNKVDGEGRSGRVKDTAKSKQGVGIRTVVDNAKGSSEQAKEEVNSEMITSERKDCNYAKGKWVADSRRPLYSGFGCKQWLAGPWSCRLSKREDFSFESYRWQPQGCEMPKFEGSNFLKRMQHRTIAIVGDSLGRQQFQSLMCMVTGGREYSEVEDVGGQYGLALRPGAQRPDGWAYRFLQTNTTILYYWSASLCELEPINRTDPAIDYAMHLDRPATYIKQYLSKFHVLVLNTGHHWNREKLTANKWVMYANGVPVTNRKLIQIYNAKNLTIYSLVKWLDSQLPQYPRLKVFFRTLSPRHFVNGEWNSGGSCDSTTPLSGGGEVTNDGSADPAVEAAVKGTRVELLDITGLSQLRDEGHISKYKSLKGAYDCLHWCLPGIPDTWNEILAARV